jgi:hypothetical protein
MNTHSHLEAALSRTNRVANESLPCAVPGCGGFRRGFSSHCNIHERRYRKYGHHEARPLTASEYKKDQDYLLKVFDEQSDHPGLAHCVKVLQAWMAQATAAEGLDRRKQPYPSARQICHLAKQGVTPQALLAAAAAAMYVHQKRPGRFPDDLSRDVSIGASVFKLVPRPANSFTRAGKKNAVVPQLGSLRHCGQFFRTNFAAIIITAHKALDDRVNIGQKVQEACRVPFKPF